MTQFEFYLPPLCKWLCAIKLAMGFLRSLGYVTMLLALALMVMGERSPHAGVEEVRQ